MRPVYDDFLLYRGRVAMDNALYGLRALIVGDNELNRRTLVEMLTHLRLKPTAVDSATSALTALRTALDEQCPYSLALLDSMMPEMDGTSFARRIRSDDRLDGISLIVLSSAGQVDDPANLRSLNISQCLTKPIKQSDLLKAIIRAAHLVKGRTTFAIAHRLSTLRNADRLIVLERGEISEIGTHAELMDKKGTFYKLVQTQSAINEIVGVGVIE